MDLAYMGFTQEADTRRFRFECQLALPRSLTTDRRIIRFVVSADMTLFLRYHIPIQEGPAISRGIVVEATARIPETELVSASYSVLEVHMESFAAARTADAQAKSARRHKPPVRR